MYVFCSAELSFIVGQHLMLKIENVKSRDKNILFKNVGIVKPVCFFNSWKNWLSLRAGQCKWE